MRSAMQPKIFHEAVRDKQLQPIARRALLFSPASVNHFFVYIMLQTNVDPSRLSLFLEGLQEHTPVHYAHYMYFLTFLLM